MTRKFLFPHKVITNFVFSLAIVMMILLCPWEFFRIKQTLRKCRWLIDLLCTVRHPSDCKGYWPFVHAVLSKIGDVLQHNEKTKISRQIQSATEYKVHFLCLPLKSKIGFYFDWINIEPFLKRHYSCDVHTNITAYQFLFSYVVVYYWKFFFFQKRKTKPKHEI